MAYRVEDGKLVCEETIRSEITLDELVTEVGNTRDKMRDARRLGEEHEEMAQRYIDEERRLGRLLTELEAQEAAARAGGLKTAAEIQAEERAKAVAR